MPYLSCNLELTKNIKCNSPFQEKFTCGIAWKSSNRKIGHHKSIKLTDLKNILQVPNCQFVNLQYGDVAEDIEEARLLTGVQLSSLDYIDPFKDIDGLLSIIQACDIIVTTSNITAHLAGALGKKTLLLVPYSQGKIWYWHHEPVNSWYPTVHQFFQSKNFDWNDAINCVAKELIREVDGKN